MALRAALLPVVLLLAQPALTHGDHQAPPTAEDWSTLHMISEHHITNFDPLSFFNLHDYDGDSIWEPQEILRTYGMAPGSTDGVGGSGATGNIDERRKDEIVRTTLDDFDTNRNGVIEKEEWVGGWGQGKRLKDWGHGPGHHGDDEYEYELHHYEKYHDENTREEDLTHPEDIAHFRKHDQMDDEQYNQQRMDKMSIVEQNIPPMFRRQ